MRDKIYINGREIECELEYNLLKTVVSYDNYRRGLNETYHTFYIDVLLLAIDDFEFIMDLVRNYKQPIQLKNDFIACTAYITNNGFSTFEEDFVSFNKYNALEDIKGRLTIASAEVLNDNVIEELKHNDKIVHRVFYK